MIKIIAAFLLSLMPLMAMESKAPEVEMYPDEMPKSKLVFQGGFPDSFFSCKNRTYFQSDYDTTESICMAFEKIGFKKMPFSSSYFSSSKQENKIFLFGNKESEEFSLVFIGIQKEEVEPRFESYPCKIMPVIYSQDKWEYPKVPSFWIGKYETLHEMSWRYIDSMLHCLPNLCWKKEETEESILESLLYRISKEKGLDKAAIRLSFVINEDNNYRAHAIYNNEEDIGTTTRLISSIIKHF